VATATAVGLATATGARAESVVATFGDGFALDALFAWADATVTSTATGYAASPLT
jgi:hypothetical protein